MSDNYTRKISIYIDTGNAQAAYNQLNASKEKLLAKNKQLVDKQKELATAIEEETRLHQLLIKNGYEAEAKKLKEVTDLKKRSYKEVTTALEANGKALEKNNEQLTRQAKKVSGELSPSLKDLTATVTRLRNELGRMSAQDPGFDEKKRQYNEARAALNNYNTSLLTVKQSLKQMLNEAKGVAFGVLIGNTVQAVAEKALSSLTGLLSGASKVSDELADIKRTTGLSTEEVARLNQQLSKLDTRTGTSNLRQLAEEAGKLGKESVEDVARFVEEFNQIRVALGEDLGDDAIIQISKASELYKESALNYASAVNEIGQSSAATERYTVEFGFRMSGVAKTVRLTAAEVMGYSAALELNGQQVEASSTALQNFFINFVKNSNKFGQAVGFARGELAKLINERGTNAAFIEWLKRLKETSASSDELLKKLEAVDIDGSRGAAALLALANSTEMVAKQQKIANDAIAQGTSITEEYANRNDNLAAKVEKLDKVFSRLTSSKSVQDFFSGAVDSLTEFVKALELNMPKITKAFNGLGKNTSDLFTNISDFFNAATNSAKGSSKYSGLFDVLAKAANDALQPIREQIAYNKSLIQTFKDGAIWVRTYYEAISEGLDVVEWQQRYKDNIEKFTKANTPGAAGAKGPLTVAGEQIDTPRSGTAAEKPLVADGGGDDKANEKLKQKLAKRKELLSNFGRAIATEIDSLGKLVGQSADNYITQMEKAYAAELKALEDELARKKAALKEDFANSLITKEEYEAGVEYIEITHVGNKINAAKYYSDTVKQAAEDAGKFQIEWQNKVADVHIRTNAAMEEAAAKAAENVKKNWYDSTETTKTFLLQLGDYAMDIWASVDRFRTTIENRQLKRYEENINKEKRLLDESLRSKSISQNQYNKRTEQLDAQLDKKKKEIELKQFKRQQALSIASIVMRGGEASMKAWADYGWPWALIPQAMIAAITIAEVANVANQEPPSYGSGIESWRAGLAGDKHSDASGGNPIIDPKTGRLLGKVERNEAIIPADSAQANQPVINWMLRNRGQRVDFTRMMSNVKFANGTPSYQSAPGYTTNNTTDSAMLMLKMDEMIQAVNRAQEKPIKFVQHDYDRFADQQDIVYTRNL